jgi:hypothetical protein
MPAIRTSLIDNPTRIASPASTAPPTASTQSQSPLIPDFGSVSAPIEWNHPTSGDYTTWTCGGGTHIDNRTCVFRNLCYDTRLWRGAEELGEDRGFWVIFDPHNISRALRDPHNERDMLSLCSVRRPEKMFHPHVITDSGGIPWAQVGVRISEPTVLMGRHQPTNWAHSMQDDFYALYWLIRTHFQGRIAMQTYRAAKRAGIANPITGTGTNVSAAPVSTIDKSGVRIVLHDQWDLGPKSYASFAQFNHFSSVTPVHPHQFRDRYSGQLSDAKPYICFDRIAAGIPGVSMQRNEGYIWEPTRTWPYPIDDEQHYKSSQQEFADFIAISHGFKKRTNWTPPPPAPAPSTARKADPARDVIVISQRKLIYKGNRRIQNLDALVEKLQSMNFGYEIVVAHLYNMSLNAQIELARRTILMIGGHGHGQFNSAFMRRGTAILELVPTRIPEMHALYKFITEHMDIRYEFLPFLDNGGGPYMDSTCLNEYSV